MHKVKRLLAGALLVGAAASPVALATSPAEATSACDTATRAGSPVIGNYVTATNGQAARSSCATVVRPQRLAANRVNFSGWIKDSATDGRNAALYAQFRVNGQWGTPRLIANDGIESWHTWSYPVTASGTVDMMAVQACGYTVARGLEACGPVTYVYNF